MFKKIQRLSDLKYLLSLEDDIWVENINKSKTFNLDEYQPVMDVLLNVYQPNELRTRTIFPMKRN
jgi:hypothetical protein